jgi:hypothetical protein
MGLAQAVKSKIVQVQQNNLQKTMEYQQQQQDLEQRKSKPSSFSSLPVNYSASLSAADTTLLQITKQKQELRQKERETLGYFTSRPGNNDLGNPKDWKTKGQVVTTMGQSNTATETTIKEWQSPRLAQETKTKQNHRFGGNKNSTIKHPTGTVDQRCACTIM